MKKTLSIALLLFLFSNVYSQTENEKTYPSGTEVITPEPA